MDAPPGILVAWGTIADDTGACLPVVVRRDAAGQVIQHERVVSFLSVSVTTGHPAVDDDEIELEVLPPHRPQLVATASMAAIRRAMCATCPYLSPFLLDDPGAAPFHLPAHAQVSEESAMSISEEPPITRATQDQAVWLYLHVLASTALCRDPEVPPPPPPPAPEAPPAPEHSCTCLFCEGDTQFSPCCRTIFCIRCSRPHLRHAPECAARRMHVSLMPRYPWGGLQPVPPAFILRPHPTWMIWQHRSGEKYCLCSYIDVEDMTYFRDWRGVDFCTTLIAKDSESSWSWVLVLEYRVRPTGPVHIRWRVFLHDRYAIPHLA